MRRLLVAVFVLAGALSLAGSGGVESGPANPCANSESATRHPDAPDTSNGTSGNDILFGSIGKDIINGKGGNDVICGNGGPDRIDGGTGNDDIEAVDGSTILGGAGVDKLLSRVQEESPMVVRGTTSLRHMTAQLRRETAETTGSVSMMLLPDTVAAETTRFKANPARSHT